MRLKLLPILFLLLPLSMLAQNSCGDTIAWNNSLCQQIGSGSLNSQWTVISRHGEYDQDETECNIPSAITQSPGLLTITVSHSSYTCGNFNSSGASCPATGCAPTGDTAPASWPYSTGDMQFNTFNFSPNGSGSSANCAGTCTITIVGSMPSSTTSTWPAFWLLGSNCQNANKWSGDTGFDNCPDVGDTDYTEIDMVECYVISGDWCQFHVANPSFGMGGGCDAYYTVNTSTHTFKTVWTSSAISLYMDGTLITTCDTSMTLPMFFIAQIQTGGVGGTPDNSNLPASLTMQSVEIQDANNNVLFSDNFPNQGATVSGQISGSAVISGSVEVQ